MKGDDGLQDCAHRKKRVHLINPFVCQFRIKQSGVTVVDLFGDDAYGKSFAALRLQDFINISL